MSGRNDTGYSGVKNIASMSIMSHKDCGLDHSPMSQMVRPEINVLDQSEEGIHQKKGTRRTGSRSVMNGSET